MAIEYVSRAYVDIDGAVIEVEEITHDIVAEGHATVDTMNRENAPKGYSSGVTKYNLTATVPRPQDGFEVDFEEMVKNKTLFQCFVEYQGGRSRSFYDCQLSSVKNTSAHAAVTKLELNFMALSSDPD